MNISSKVSQYKIYIFLVIILISFFLRFYRIEQVHIFNFDEEYQATYAWTLVKDPHPIWIGVSASFLDFYLGPYFTYLTAILLAFSNGNPVSTAFFAAILGIVSTALVFFIGWRIFNLTTAIVSAFLYASLPLIVFFDQKYWNTMFTGLITYLLFVSMYLIKKSIWFWVLYAALFGAILETHLEPAPLLLIGVFYFFKNKVWQNIKVTLVCLVVFLIFYWPLIVFDINHNFSNVTSFTRIGKGFSESKIAFDPTIKMNSLIGSLGRFWYLEPGNPNADEITFSCNPLTVKIDYKNIDLHSKRTNPFFPFSLISLGIISYFLFISFKNESPQITLLGMFLAVGLVSFLIYPGSSSEYYTLSILYLFLFVPGILISSFRGYLKIFMYLCVIIISLFGINTVLKTSDEFSLGPKKILISKVMEVVGDKSFSIEGRGICHNYEGWRYLFKVYGRSPSQSYTDKNLGWLYPEEISKENPMYTVILSEDRIPLEEVRLDYPSIKEGGYKAYIKKNF